MLGKPFKTGIAVAYGRCIGGTCNRHSRVFAECWDTDMLNLLVSTQDPSMSKVFEACFQKAECIIRYTDTLWNSSSSTTKADSMILIIDAATPADAERELEARKSNFSENIAVLVCRDHLDGYRPLSCQVSGMVPVQDAETCLRRAVLLGLSGFSVFKGTVTELIGSPADTPEIDLDLEKLASLSAMEARVLLCLAEGGSNKAIARQLGISNNTVRVHMRTIFVKTGMENRTQAALLAIRYRYTGILTKKARPLALASGN